ncbi:MAG: hypothetical protein GY711_12475 [bacterium]|nr:hypothetical protein [bacterium]
MHWVALGATAAGVLSGLRIFVTYNLLEVEVSFLEGITSGLMDWWLWIPFVPLVLALARRFDPSAAGAVRFLALHVLVGAAISFAQLTLFSRCPASSERCASGTPLVV